ncbi:PL29 family lyase N-terminal domain-containing protein [Bacteroides gallinaceum]|uniref:PL29 family lyase N-terminal domain-containing protein n=1 Tax=Bacteroides gallinaceum TaxID=1462571 RepID=A0ABT7XAB2_9BACE|nr:PL29 family lyase N-terminal domain-containing protein [Bacteroides gallinaceum]MDN0051025.1 PL29 family lyase N-terminal domain-containing protein [Bacteroides gallinaceum]
MRKKYLSALLFGALLFASTGTFTSCKDYDDDITNLQTQVDGVKSEVEALQTKINDGKWITNIADAEGGFTITFSDNTSYTITNGKDGQDGAAGAAGTPGTQWTISEDGYWVCDGEKTDVKAVGQDGKDGAAGQDGQDAQPEVKKENGKWYLWNGTEFEELNIAASAANVPYYYVDPNDNNYAVLVITDENGQNKKEIRLPLTEGLAQIQILRTGERATSTTLSINYAISKEGTAFEEWNGSKAKPAKGEYIITQSTDSILVQVTPANYDLAALDLKVINANNEEVPVTLGEPVPYKGELTYNSRAASTTGMYLIPVVHNAITDENTEDYETAQFVSIVANDKVRSAFDGSFRFSLNDAEDYTDNIAFGQYTSETSYRNMWAQVEPGKSFTIDVVRDREYLYDAYVTMYDGSDKDEEDWTASDKADITQAAADQVRYDIKCDGLTITCNDKAASDVYFTVHYMDVTGRVHHEKFRIRYAEEAAPVETITTIENVAHTATGETKNQYIIVDLAPYFETMTANERLVWNDEYDTYRDANWNKRFMVEYYDAFEDKDGNPQYGIKWEYENKETGRTETVFGNTDLLGADPNNINIVALKADGTEATQGSEVAKLKIPFDTNYGNLAIDAENYAKGQYNVKVAVMNWIKDSDGYYSSYNTVAYLDVPFTIAEPTAAELQKQYTYNSFYYNATDGVFTVVDIDQVNISELIQGTTLNNAELETAADYNGEVNVYADGTIRWNATDNDGEEVAKGKVYSFTGATFQYLKGTFDIPAFKVKFVNSQPYSLNMASANITLQSGDVTSTDNIVYAEKATKDEPIFYNVKDVFSKFVAATNIASVEIVDFVSPKGQTGADLLEYPTVSGQTITVKATAEKASQNSTSTVKVKVTMNDGETVDGQFTVTIKAYPHN